MTEAPTLKNGIWTGRWIKTGSDARIQSTLDVFQLRHNNNHTKWKYLSLSSVHLTAYSTYDRSAPSAQPDTNKWDHCELINRGYVYRASRWIIYYFIRDGKMQPTFKHREPMTDWLRAKSDTWTDERWCRPGRTEIFVGKVQRAVSFTPPSFVSQNK